MVDHHLLHRELANLAAGISADGFDLHDGLHQLSLTTTAALGLDGAGVTMHMGSGDTEYIAASDAVTLGVEKCQDELKQGACIDAINSSEIVAVNDLTDDARWPDYTPYVLQAGFEAVAGVPAAFRGSNIGALNLYAASSRAWTTDEFSAAQMVADLAAGYLVNRHLLDQSQTLAAQLQHALTSRILIEQAKGVLCGRHGMAPDAAFEIIRSFARSNRIKIQDVADGIVGGKIDMAATSGALADADNGGGSAT